MTEKQEHELKLIQLKQLIEEKYFTKYAQLSSIDKYTFSKLNSPYDVAFISGSTNILGESKVRPDKGTGFFISYGAMLEQKKLKGMKLKANHIFKTRGKIVLLYYINFTADSIMLYELKDESDYIWENWLLPKDNINPRIKVNKIVTKLFNPIEIIRLKK